MENHQNTNYWETHSPFSDHPDNVDGTIENGLYVIRQIGMSNTSAQFAKLLIPADGRFSWSVVQALLNPFGGTKILPEWYRGAPNITSGYHDLELVPHSYSYPGIQNPSTIAFIRDTVNHTWIYPQYYLGDGKDAFRMTYNQVFSPWSNPNNQRASDDTTHFGFEITNFNSGVYTLNLYVNSSSGASPSKPQNLTVSGGEWENPVLTWEPNTEPDLKSYKIYRKNHSDIWRLAATINAYNGSTPVTTWTDTEVDVRLSQPYIYYKMCAVDNDEYESLASNVAQIHGRLPKNNSLKSTEEIINSNILLPNYPNPFNPGTRITYTLKDKDHITLIVYDILGKEVARLVNGLQTKGEHVVNFNGNNLPSGIYIYKLTGSNFNISKKMLLIK